MVLYSPLVLIGLKNGIRKEMVMANFFKKGIADRPPNMQRAKNQRRFWLKKDMKAKDAVSVVFAHKGDFISFWEHTIDLDDALYSFTCLQKNKIEKVCPLCTYGDTPYYIGIATIIDRSSYQNKDGETVSDNKKLLAAKTNALDLIAVQLELNKERTAGDLYGCEFRVLRSASETSAAVGDSWNFTKKYSEKEMVEIFGEEKIQQFDYNTLFEPYSIDDLDKIVALLPSAEAYFAKKPFGKKPGGKGGKFGKPAAAPAPAAASGEKKAAGTSSDIPF